MSLSEKLTVTCRGCKADQQVEIVRSINTHASPELKGRLLAGTLNVLSCHCGRRSTLQATLLFHDPAAAYMCQLCVGDDTVEKAAADFREVGVTGTLRAVLSLNALIEKVKLLDAGLEDWAVEIVKVLLLASLGIRDMNRVLLFEGVDRIAGTLSWVLFDENNAGPRLFTGPLMPYDKGLAKWATVAPARDVLQQIDRFWALEALRRVMPAG